jgi:hypothetical protein
MRPVQSGKQLLNAGGLRGGVTYGVTARMPLSDAAGYFSPGVDSIVLAVPFAFVLSALPS